MADQDIDELWRSIPAHPDYEVSNLGRVRRVTDVTYPMPNGGIATKLIAGNILTNSRLSPWRNHNLPYARVGLLDRGSNTTKGVMVHKLVGRFIPNPDNKPCVNHINSDAFDAAVRTSNGALTERTRSTLTLPEIAGSASRTWR